MALAKLTKFLSRHKVATLNQVALLCGLKSETTKLSRVERIIEGVELFNHVARTANVKKLSILAIDIGIKNFSYCFTKNVDLTSFKAIKVDNWDKIDLNEAYGSSYTPIIGVNTLFEEKRYINHISKEISSSLLLHKPDLVIMETQRIRSSDNPMTLPTVLRNFTLENLIYSHLYTADRIVIPMASSQMINFWLNRFISKESMKAKKRDAKHFRLEIVFDWFNNPDWLIENTFTEPGEFEKRSLLKSLNLPIANNKVDDLIDSLLYNLTIIQHLRNQRILISYLEEERDLDEFVDKYNKVQLNLIKPLIETHGLKLHKEFLHHKL